MRLLSLLLLILLTSICVADETPPDDSEPTNEVEVTKTDRKSPSLAKNLALSAARVSHQVRRQIDALQGRPVREGRRPAPQLFTPRFGPEYDRPFDPGTIGYDTQKCQHIFFIPNERVPSDQYASTYSLDYIYHPDPILELGDRLAWVKGGTRHILELASNTHMGTKAGQYITYQAVKNGSPTSNTNQKSFDEFVREVHRISEVDPSISEALRNAKLSLPPVHDKDIPLPRTRNARIMSTDETEAKFAKQSYLYLHPTPPEDSIELKAPGVLVWLDGLVRHELSLRQGLNGSEYRASLLSASGRTDITALPLYIRFYERVEMEKKRNPTVQRALQMANVEVWKPFK